MLYRMLLLFFVGLASALPKDYPGRDKPFGLPDSVADLLDEHQVDIPERTPSTLREHLWTGSDDDYGPFRAFWENMMPKAHLLTTADWTHAGTEQLSPAHEIQLPHLGVLKHEIPPFPELPLGDLLPIPGLKLPDLKILEYEAPPLPTLLNELPSLPELKLPEFKFVKYEVPPLPTLPMELPSLPELKLPDLKIFEYEFPPLPTSPMELPSLPELKLPDLKIFEYEVPPLPTLPMELPSLPELKLPDFKIVKYELPPFPTLPPIELPLKLPDLKIINYELPPIPEVNVLDFKFIGTGIPPLPGFKLPKLTKTRLINENSSKTLTNQLVVPHLPGSNELQLSPFWDLYLPEVNFKYDFPEVKINSPDHLFIKNRKPKLEDGWLVPQHGKS